MDVNNDEDPLTPNNKKDSSDSPPCLTEIFNDQDLRETEELLSPSNKN